MPSLLPTLTTLLRLFSLLSVLTISSLAGLLYTYQGKLIYPSSLPAGSREDKTRPDAFRLPFEEEWLVTPDGEKLHAWYISDSPEEKREGKGKGQRVVIIMFQANAGNMAHRLPIADVLFRKLGCEVVMFSYRGYGLSSGTPSERGIQVDAQVVVDWVRRRVREEEGGGGAGGEMTKIVLYGQSLGGAVAISTASRNSSSNTTTTSSTTPGISALILENTFTSIPALIPSVLPPARFFTFLCRETWHSDLALSSVDPRMSILFLSGAKDELIPPRMMRELWGIATKRRGKGAREWVSLEKGTHNDTCMQRGYWGAVASFLQRRVGLDTEYARQAVQAGYSEEKMCVGPLGEGDGEGEKGELVAEGSSDNEEEEKYGDDWTEEKDVGSSTAAKAASAAGVRKRGGAGGAGPADVVDEEIETDGVRSARLGKL